MDHRLLVQPIDRISQTEFFKKAPWRSGAFRTDSWRSYEPTEAKTNVVPSDVLRRLISDTRQLDDAFVTGTTAARTGIRNFLGVPIIHGATAPEKNAGQISNGLRHIFLRFQILDLVLSLQEQNGAFPLVAKSEMMPDPELGERSLSPVRSSVDTPVFSSLCRRSAPDWLNPGPKSCSLLVRSFRNGNELKLQHRSMLTPRPRHFVRSLKACKMQVCQKSYKIWSTPRGSFVLFYR